MRQEHGIRSIARRVAGAALLAVTVAGVAQAQENPREHAPRQDWGEARYREVIGQLRAGRAALLELGRDDLADAVGGVMRELRGELGRGARADGGERGGGDDALDLDQIGACLEVLRWARAAHAEAGHREAAAGLEQTIHTGELFASGVAGEELSEAAAHMPSLEARIDLLAGASRWYAEHGHERRANACRRLAGWYEERSVRGAAAQEREPTTSLEDRARRVELIELARGAHARLRHEDAADALARFARIGRMQLEGVEPEAYGELARGLSMGRLIELIQAASGIYREWGQAERAELCNALAEFYARRERERADEEAEEAGEVEETGEAPVERDLSDRARRVEILRWARDAQREAGDEEATGYLERLVRVGELQLEGVEPARLAEAAEGLDMERTIGLVRIASKLYDERGWETRSALCAELARFYAARLRGADDGDAARQAGGREDRAAAERDRRDQLEAESAHIEARIAELRAQLERLRVEMKARRERRER